MSVIRTKGTIKNEKPKKSDRVDSAWRRRKKCPRWAPQSSPSSAGRGGGESSSPRTSGGRRPLYAAGGRGLISSRGRVRPDGGSVAAVRPGPVARGGPSSAAIRSRRRRSRCASRRRSGALVVARRGGKRYIIDSAGRAPLYTILSLLLF